MSGSKQSRLKIKLGLKLTGIDLLCELSILHVIFVAILDVFITERDLVCYHVIIRAIAFKGGFSLLYAKWTRLVVELFVSIT